MKLYVLNSGGYFRFTLCSFLTLCSCAIKGFSYLHPFMLFLRKCLWKLSHQRTSGHSKVKSWINDKIIPAVKMSPSGWCPSVFTQITPMVHLTLILPQSASQYRTMSCNDFFGMFFVFFHIPRNPNYQNHCFYIKKDFKEKKEKLSVNSAHCGQREGLWWLWPVKSQLFRVLSARGLARTLRN